ncbi:hypothetical protein CAEBREN_01521 [Caenorhabditis brenneri]|uniref:F-box domain-containing protein n=1 Tax=Caenorhabditis brenneri TaxID=135651 RepID=G0P881_CAEBE|nr:hypothetical protein CAEBREN_01521 [Caenorhabditis brenneri]
MTIKFTRFPALIKLAIIKEMSYMDVFYFSLCSMKIRKFIENYRKKDVKIVRYSLTSKLIQVFAGKRVFGEEVMVSARALPTVMPAYFTRIGSVRKSVSFQWQEEKLLGFYRNFMEIIFRTTSAKSVKNAILEHVTALFNRSSPVIQLQIFIDQRPGKQIHIPGVKDTRIRGEQVDAKFLEEFFRNNPGQISAFIEPEITGRLSVVSKIYQLPGLSCRNSSKLSASIMKRFRGIELQLCKAECTTRDIVSFLKMWILNKRRSLKCLHIFFSRPIDTQKVIDHFQLRRWSLEPYSLKYKTIIMDIIHKSVTFDCRRGWQVQRQEDKQMAVLFFSEISLLFIVWDRTRDQFVEVIQ